MVEINQPDFTHAGAGERGDCMAADAAAANYNDEGGAQGGEARVGEEDAVTRQLFKDEV